jgi:hypothetical protein
MEALTRLDEANAWRVSGVRKAPAFFHAVAALVPDATTVFLEGSPSADIVALMQPHIEHADYLAPAGTFWSWPQRNRRFRLRAPAELFARLSEAAPRHAEPEICDHLHIYVEAEPLVTWFDAFTEPVFVSKAIARDRVEQFCHDVGGVLSDHA